MEEDGNSLELFKFLQPDLLTINQLIFVLKSKCVNANWSSLSKADLVELFKRVALPLPQREYLQTSRGILLTKLRRKQQNTVKSSPKNDVKTFTIGVNGVSTSSLIQPILKDRLKLPPCIAHQSLNDESRVKITSVTTTLEPVKVESRRIKINFNSSVDSRLDKLIIKDHKKQKLDSPKGNTTLVEQRSSQNGIISKPEINTTKKITLKRSHLCLQVNNSKNNEVKSEVVEKQRKTITWP